MRSRFICRLLHSSRGRRVAETIFFILLMDEVTHGNPSSCQDPIISSMADNEDPLVYEDEEATEQVATEGSGDYFSFRLAPFIESQIL